MDPRLGHLSFEMERAPLLPTPVAAQERKYSEDTAREIDRAVREIVKVAFERALAILTRHRRTLEDAARELLQKETLGEPAVAAIARRLGMRAETASDKDRVPRSTSVDAT
jgi:cell division protease FtsH